MKLKRAPRAPILCLILLALSVLPGKWIFAQTLRLDSPGLTNGAVVFSVIGPTNTYHRVDSSADLRNWSPIDAFLDDGRPHRVIDPLAQGNRAQFYRAVNTDPDLKVLDFSPASGPAGVEVAIIGQFFPPPAQVLVRFGSATARVISGTSTRLVVQVPAEAATSRITVTTAGDRKTSAGVFVVQANALVTFNPPAGISAADFEINNNQGSAVALASPAGAFSIPVRVGSPNITFATPKNTNSSLFFCAVSLDAAQPIVISAASTAETLVFQDPHLMVQDPGLAASVLGVIHTNSAVQAFAQVLSQKMGQSAAPLLEPDVKDAYVNAVVSVANGAPVRALAQVGSEPSASHAGLRSFSSDIQIYPLEAPTRFLDITPKGTKISASVDEYLYNPVDWLVVFQKVDVDKAFPNGTIDFDPIKNSTEETPQLYPVAGTFYAERSVAANFVSSRLNVVSTLTTAIYSAIIPKIVDDKVQLPEGDGLYLVRGVGPSLRTAEDFEFVNANMPDVYVRIVGLNLAAAAMELASLVVDDSAKDAVARAAELQGLASNALKKAPGVRSIDEFKIAAYSLVEGLFKDFAKNKIKTALGATVKLISENLTSITAKLKTASAVGQLIERAAGLQRTTALETTFVMVGDPFQLHMSVQPPLASPGQDIIVEFSGSASMRAFDTNNAADNVTFEGASSFFNGEVIEVTGPNSLGIQRLKVRIPVKLGNTADGPYTLYLNTQGRRGNAPFTVSTAAALASVTPVQGFAAAADFNGTPYPGTRVHLQGAVFTVSDTFLFAGGTSGVEATNKAGGGAAKGDVFVSVPAGAATGPLQIRHPSTNGSTLQITGPIFTVFGPPQIQSIQPASAPPGTTLNLGVANAGVDASLIYAQFTGTTPSTVSLLANSAITFAVPSQAQTGPLKIITPAGIDQVPFTVLAPVPFAGQIGAVISVGGNSPITLPRAIALANGDATPVDGPDDSTDLSPDPPEEGDFVSPDNQNRATPRWPVGLLYQDTISVSGTNADDADFYTSYDVLSRGTLTGKITISGHNNTFSGVIFAGPVVVTGYSNRFNDVTFLAPATFVSSNNFVSRGTVQAPMTILGENNNFQFPTFQGVAGNALTVKGNRNILVLNVWTNAGDGVVIDGGKYNNLQCNSNIGNAGNGITLTGGAEGNYVTVATSHYAPGSGNAGHGLALIGNAVANAVTGQFAGHGMDGIYLDGPGVTLNQFTVHVASNGRNGITLTNGAHLNRIGDPRFDFAQSIYADQNAGSGVALMGCGENALAVWARTNGQYGVLVSNVKVPANQLQIIITTTGPGLSNGKAALRLEKGTSGVHALLHNTTGSDLVGLEMDGEDVTGNWVEGQISNTLSHGAVIHGARNNEINLSVSHAGADGILVNGAANNLFRLVGCDHNASNGVHVALGAFGNRFTSWAGPPFTASIDHNFNGMVFDTDAHDNSIELMNILTNSQDGLVFSGASHNALALSTIVQVARDGIRFENGAQNNIIGSDAVDDAFNTREITVQGCGAAGVRMTGNTVSGNVLRRCMIGASFFYGGQPSGIVVEAGAEAGLITRSTLQQNTDGMVFRTGASGGALVNLSFQQNTNSAITITNASSIRIGGPGGSDENEISQSRTGIDISGPGATNNVLFNNHVALGTDGVYLHDGAQANQLAGGNRLENNLRGLRIEAASGNIARGSTIQSNQTSGILIARGAAHNTVQGNVIANNAVGVLVADDGTVENSILGNSITANAGKGIQLSNGGNINLAAPVLRDYFGVTVDGTADAPDDSRVEIFRDSDDEGETWLGAGTVQNGRFSVPIHLDPSEVGAIFRLNGTVTDPDGNTSEFSGPFKSEFPLSRLAFTSLAAGNREVFLWDGAGNPVNLTQNSADDYTPALGSARCDQLLFVSTRAGKQNVFVMPSQSGALARLVVTNAANNYEPSWLSDCQRIVFTSDKDGPPQIYSMNLDGTGLQRLTSTPSVNHSPKASLDGSKIVFMSNRSGTDEIYSMNADGTDQHLVAKLGGTASQPAFSPDGTLIAFARGTGAKTEIWTVTADGNTLVQVTADAARASHPAWLLDGEHLIFSSNKSGTTQLYSVSRIGGPSQALPFAMNGDEPSVSGP